MTNPNKEMLFEHFFFCYFYDIVSKIPWFKYYNSETWYIKFNNIDRFKPSIKPRLHKRNTCMHKRERIVQVSRAYKKAYSLANKRIDLHNKQILLHSTD